MTTHPDHSTLTVDNFPITLRRQMRAIAALQGKTLREAVLEAAQLWVTTHSTDGTPLPHTKNPKGADHAA